MEKIKNVKINRRYNSPLYWGGQGPTGHIEVSCKFVIPLPISLSTLPNVIELAQTYLQMFDIESIEDGNAIFAYGPVSFGLFRKEPDPLDPTVMVNTNVMITDVDIKTALEERLVYYTNTLAAFMPMPFDPAVGASFDGTSWSYIPPPVTP